MICTVTDQQACEGFRVFFVIIMIENIQFKKMYKNVVYNLILNKD